jgi:diguanylate cyclase (GGDEF)-like protein
LFPERFGFMSGAAFILAINLAVSGVLAMGFLLIAGYDRSYVSARWIALAYALGVTYFVLEFLIKATPGPVVDTIAYATFLATLAAFAIGMARKYDTPPPWLAIGVIFAVSVVVNLYAQGLPRQTFLRNFLWQAPYAAMQALSVIAVFRGRGRTKLDNALGVFLALGSLQFLTKPWIAAYAGGPGATPDAYLDTTYAMFSQTLGAVFGFSVALITVAVYVRSMLSDAVTRSETDTLSGLLNRRGFEDKAEALLVAMARARRPVSLVIADIDHFKAVNDTYGHETGDQVIVAFASALRQVSGDAHPIGRIGGEEFAIALSGMELQTARLVAEGARVAFAQARVTGMPVGETCTASFGVAQWRGEEDYGELIRRADLALYEAKKAGRDCVRIAPPGRRPTATVDDSGDRRSLRGA